MAFVRTVGDMRGDQHLLISLLSGLLILVPFIPAYAPAVFTAIMAGLVVGSLAPDADARDAAIFHKRIKIRGTLGAILRHIGYILPFFGYLIRYLIYFPVSLLLWIFTRKVGWPRHRGLLHSITGMVLTVFLIGFYSYVAMYVSGISISYFSLPFLSAFTLGFMMHLLEDSCTPSGIAWLFPFSRVRVCGEIRVDSKREKRPIVLAFTLCIAIITLFITGSYYEEDLFFSLGIPSLMLLAVWSVFLICAGVRFKT